MTHKLIRTIFLTAFVVALLGCDGFKESSPTVEVDLNRPSPEMADAGWIDESVDRTAGEEMEAAGEMVMEEPAEEYAVVAEAVEMMEEVEVTRVMSSETASSADDGLELATQPAALLTAGEVDDNAGWDDYITYRRQYSGGPIIEVDVTERHQIFVRDQNGSPVLGARLSIVENGEMTSVLRTHSDGRAYLFPRALGLSGDGGYEVEIEAGDQRQTLTIPAGTSQREWDVTLTTAGAAAQQTRLDILFLIDATGSMGDEINQLKNNIEVISARINALPSRPDVRFAMTVYRDRGDLYTSRTFEFTPNVEDFAAALRDVTADGGGDYPEDLNEGLFKAVRAPEWRIDDTVSLIFLVADAPPHLDYADQNYSYASEIQEAARRGIKIYPIASSGLDDQGEYIFRQIAQYTGGRFLFLTYGAGGAGTTGTETDMHVDDYDVTSLDGLVIKIVEEELAFRNWLQ